MATDAVSNAHLLLLPFELRAQIYSYLIQPSTDLTIRCLFIRERFRSVFMTQQRKDVHCNLLLVCRQISDEALPLLYAAPTWQCGCRLDGLASQIGAQNFGSIQKMSVDFDDLAVVAASLERKQSRSLWGETYHQNLCFDNLEVLHAAGFQISALHSRATQTARLEAIRLCKLARRVLHLHPKLKLLVQETPVNNGGSDAVDVTWGRVRWKFIADLRLCNRADSVVDISEVIEALSRTFDDNPVSTDKWLSEYEHSLTRHFTTVKQ